LSADAEVAVRAGHAAVGALSVPLAFSRGIALTLSSLETASLDASATGHRPHACRIGDARDVVGAVLNSAGLGAGLVDAPLAHDGGSALRVSGAERASSTAANITFIEDAARIGIAGVNLFVLELALEVASVVAGMPEAHGVRLAGSRGSVTEALHLALGGGGRPLAVRIGVAVSNLGVGHVFVLALLVAATLSSRPVAHGRGEASSEVSEASAVLTTAEHERIPHTLGVEVARRLSSVAVTAGLQALLSDGNARVEAAHGVGSTFNRQGTSGVVQLVLVDGAALADTLASLGIPHAVRRSIAERRGRVSVDALLGARTTAESVAEAVGTAGITFDQRAAVNADLESRMPLAGSVSGALVRRQDAAATSLATVGAPSTFSVVVAKAFLRSVVAVLAVEVAGSGVGVPAAHLFELLAADFRVDASASFNAEVVEDVPHTLGVVDASGAVEVLELTLGLARSSSASVDDTVGVPVAERRGCASVLVFRLVAGVLADAGGVRPDTLGIEVAVGSVTVLVAAHLFALVLNPGAHRDGLAENTRLESVAAAIATVTEVVPFAIGVGVARAFGLVHVEALLRASLLEVDEAHCVEFAGIGSVGPAVGAALGLFDGPHATRFSVTFLLSVVGDLATSVASKRSTVPVAVGIGEAIVGAEDVRALQRALLLGLQAVDAKRIGDARSLIFVVIARALANFSEGVPLTFGVLDASTTSGVATERADEVADGLAIDLPVALSHRLANFAAVEDGALLEAEVVDGVPHAGIVFDAVLASVPLGFAALDTLGQGRLSDIPEAHLITAAESFSGETRGLFVGRARLDASSGVVVPLAIGIVVTREVSTDTDVAVLADESARGGVELPFADGAGDTLALGFDEAASADADVGGEVPSAVAIHDASGFRGVDVLTLLGAGGIVHDTHGVGETGSGRFAFSSSVASAGLDAFVGLEVPHAVGVAVASVGSAVGETAGLAASHGVVTVGILGLVEEKLPVAATISNARSVVEVFAFEGALILVGPLAHGLSDTVVLRGSESALGCADVVVDIPHAASIGNAASLVASSVLELACAFAGTDSRVPVAERTEFASGGGRVLRAILAAEFEVGVPHAERILGAVGGGRS
jgi:hypothetical protein